MPAVEATVITPPRPRSTIAGTNACVRVTTASQLTRTISAPRGGSSSSERPRRPKPALLRRRSTSTPSLATSPGSLAALEARSHLITGAVVGTSAASFSRRSLRRATRIRSWPRRASCLANSSPMPAEAPVISAVSATGRSLVRNFGGRVAGLVPPRLRTSSHDHEHGDLRGAGPLLGGPVPLGPGDAVLSGAEEGAGGGQPGAYSGPARPRPDRSLQGVPAAQAQDAGVRCSRGGPLPDPAHPHA